MKFDLNVIHGIVDNCYVRFSLAPQNAPDFLMISFQGWHNGGGEYILNDVERGPSSSIEDWSREMPRQFWDPGRKLLKSIRTYQRLQQSSTPWAFLVRKLCTLRHRFWSVVSGAEIPLNTRIAGGLSIPHPNGIVIQREAEIGPNCLIFHQVTIGLRQKGGGVPRLGGNVVVGAGAKVLGSVIIGDNARIGANAVVVASVPEGVTVAGIPAKPIAKN